MPFYLKHRRAFYYFELVKQVGGPESLMTPCGYGHMGLTKSQGNQGHLCWVHLGEPIRSACTKGVKQSLMQGDCHSTSIFCWQEQGKAERDGRKELAMRDARELKRKREPWAGKVIKSNEDIKDWEESQKVKEMNNPKVCGDRKWGDWGKTQRKRGKVRL